MLFRRRIRRNTATGRDWNKGSMAPGAVPLRRRTATGIAIRSSSATDRSHGPARASTHTVRLPAVRVPGLAAPVVEWPGTEAVAAGRVPAVDPWRHCAVMIHRLSALFAGALLLWSGLVFAQSAPGAGRAQADVWGDPEDEETGSEQTWTWFGMGYENRAQTSVRPADAASDAAGATGNSTGSSNGSNRGSAGSAVGNGRGRNRARGGGRNP